MTLPSELLDSIRRTLAAALIPSTPPDIDHPLVDVMISDDISEDVADYETVPDPGIVVSCLGLTDLGAGHSELQARANFIARCYARIAEGPEDLDGSTGDVAMDLAALVALLVERSIWVSAGPSVKPLVTKRAENVRVANRTARGKTSKGRALWTVTWSQQVELGQRDEARALHAFRKLNMTIAMGDAQTEDAVLHVEMPGGTP